MQRRATEGPTATIARAFDRTRSPRLSDVQTLVCCVSLSGVVQIDKPADIPCESHYNAELDIARMS